MSRCIKYALAADYYAHNQLGNEQAVSGRQDLTGLARQADQHGIKNKLNNHQYLNSYLRAFNQLPLSGPERDACAQWGLDIVAEIEQSASPPQNDAEWDAAVIQKLMAYALDARNGFDNGQDCVPQAGGPHAG